MPLVVANEEGKDQRKRGCGHYRLQSDAPFEDVVGGVAPTVSWLESRGREGDTPLSVGVNPQISASFRVPLIVISAENRR